MLRDVSDPNMSRQVPGLPDLLITQQTVPALECQVEIGQLYSDERLLGNLDSRSLSLTWRTQARNRSVLWPLHRLPPLLQNLIYRVSNDTGHPQIWLSPKPLINLNWTPGNQEVLDFIKSLGLRQISGCPVLWATLYIIYLFFSSILVIICPEHYTKP